MENQNNSITCKLANTLDVFLCISQNAKKNKEDKKTRAIEREKLTLCGIV